jgi:putative NADH-flavin reductase
VARCLIIGCGCRGRSLARELIARGHTVRGTTRDPAKRSAIEAAGAEAAIADPDRVVTLVPAFEHVAVAYVLLGSAGGDPSLHGTRLDMLLHRMVDTTVRGIVYEARGSADSALLEAGAAIVSAVSADARIPYVLLDADPSDHDAWVAAAVGGAERVLG